MWPSNDSAGGMPTAPGAGACQASHLQTGQFQATHWNVAKIRPGAERGELPHYLTTHGFPTFCPLLLARNTRHHVVRAPLFAGYLFVRFDPRLPGWHVVTRAIGVAYLLAGPDGMPRPVPPPVMARMLAEPEIEAPGARAPQVAGVKPAWRSLAALTPDERRALLVRWTEPRAA